jgi:DNA polymerase III sliding clamp (beta) subunit (PCNA family)
MAAGNVSEGKVDISKDEETSIALDGKGPVKAKYSLEYLKKIIKGSRLSDKVRISFNKDYPLMVDYKVTDKLQLSTVLAPRVSEED